MLETCFFLIEELIKADNTKKIYLYKLKLKLEMVALTESHRRCCLSGVHLCSHTNCSSYPKTEQRNVCTLSNFRLNGPSCRMGRTRNSYLNDTNSYAKVMNDDGRKGVLMQSRL